MYTLKPRKYYSLNYSVIPDNKIRQVVGAYTETVYSGSMTSTSDEYNHYVYTYRDGHTGIGSLPLIGPTVASDYAGDFYVDATFEADPGTSFAHNQYRTEKVAVTYTMTILSEKPCQFSGLVSDLSIVDISGYAYTSDGDTEDGLVAAVWEMFDGDDDKLYAPYIQNSQWGPGYTTAEINNAEIKSVSIDSNWDGKKVDPNTGKYKITLYIAVYVVNNTLQSYRYQSLNTHFVYHGVMNLLWSFRIEAIYYEAVVTEHEFEYHTADADYTQYPLKVSGNEYTNGNTNYNGVSWHTWISQQLLDKYKNGKIFINAKIKASYLIENQLDINSELLIKDIDNQFIRRGEQMCVFQLKNIEYTYSGTEYIADVILLESYTIEEQLLDTGFNYVIAQISEVDITSSTCQLIIVDKPIACFKFPVEVVSTDIINPSLYDTVYFDIPDIETEVLTPLAPSWELSNGVELIIESDIVPQTSASFEKTLAGLDMNVDSKSIDIKRTAFNINEGFKGYASMYTFVKVSTSWSTSILFDSSEVTAVSANCIDLDIPLNVPSTIATVEALIANSLDLDLVNLNLVSDIQVNVSLNENLLEPKAVLDFGPFEPENVSFKVQEDFKQIIFTLSIGFTGSVTIMRLMDRPIDDEYFFNLSIEDWISLSIENMLEIKA